MTFLEALNSQKKVRSEFWSENQTLDTTIFTDEMDDMIKQMLSITAKPITWQEILGLWFFV